MPTSSPSRPEPGVSGRAGLDHVLEEVARGYRGAPDAVRLAFAAILARGHVLVEDVPGVGKTTLARSLAHVMGLDFRRIQFTADLLPSDLLGVPVHDPSTGRFRFRPGPIFSQVLLADEINRAPPRTQSGLLQAMQEGEVTVDRTTRPLPRPFIVLATQNPLEHHGTYPLPESQLDRFLLRLAPGYPTAESERLILLDDSSGTELESRITPLLTPEKVLALQARVDTVSADPDLLEYVLEFVRRTRAHPALRTGVSPRGAVALFRAARAVALVGGRDYLIPDDVTDLIQPCLGHRIVLRRGSGDSAAVRTEARSILTEIFEGLPLPV